MAVDHVHKPFITEKQATQFIVNSYSPNVKGFFKLGFGGMTGLYLYGENPKVPFRVGYLFRDYSTGKSKTIPLGYYSSEELENLSGFFLSLPSSWKCSRLPRCMCR